MLSARFTTLIFDGTFDGLLTAVFESFEYRLEHSIIKCEAAHVNADLFAQEHLVITNTEKASRVLEKLKILLGKEGIAKLMRVYYSEDEHAPDLILYAIKYALKNTGQNIFQNYADEQILKIAQLCKNMGREIHRMHAFLRFEELQDGTFFAKIAPDFDVMPFIWKHFKHRYAAMDWMIFDEKRNYGVLYYGGKIDFFEADETNINNLSNSSNFHSDKEANFQKLWQRYFIKTGIPSRKNMKLHIQKVPKRYWKYLTEITI